MALHSFYDEAQTFTQIIWSHFENIKIATFPVFCSTSDFSRYFFFFFLPCWAFSFPNVPALRVAADLKYTNILCYIIGI